MSQRMPRAMICINAGTFALAGSCRSPYHPRTAAESHWGRCRSAPLHV